MGMAKIINIDTHPDYVYHYAWNDCFAEDVNESYSTMTWQGAIDAGLLDHFTFDEVFLEGQDIDNPD